GERFAGGWGGGGRRVGGEPPAVGVEPLLRVAIVASASLDELPERGAVMGLDEVADLVDDDVVEHVVRGEHEPPVEAQLALRRARAPPAALVAHDDAAVAHAERDRLGLCDQLAARTRLAATLFFGERQPLEPEDGRRRTFELTCEPW